MFQTHHRPSRSNRAESARRPHAPSVAHVLVLALACGIGAAPAPAGEADVLEGALTALGGDRYRIEATVRHADTGWDHYANRWDVLAPDGALLGSRELLHPHEDEQPFTRSLTLEIPPGIERVTLRAFDSVHEGGGASVELDVPR